MGRENITAIAASEALRKIKELPVDASLRDRFRVAAREVVDHWLCTDESERFKAAVAALLMSTEVPKDRAAVEREIITISNVSEVFVQKRPLNELLILEDGQPLGLLKIWGEIANPQDKENE